MIYEIHIKKIYNFVQYLIIIIIIFLTKMNKKLFYKDK